MIWVRSLATIFKDCHTDEKSVVGIVRTNGLPVETPEGDMVGVYPTVSRFNHSCNNNANALKLDRT